jgi:hypothetical protein
MLIRETRLPTLADHGGELSGRGEARSQGPITLRMHGTNLRMKGHRAPDGQPLYYGCPSVGDNGGAVMATATYHKRVPCARWPGYAASAWAFTFAAVSFYWALGGTVGLATLGTTLHALALARDPTAIAVGGWGAGVAKLLGGLLPLALLSCRRLPLSRRALRALAAAGGAGMALYGGASLVQHVLMLTGVIALPAGLGPLGARWHLWLWDPWWLLGGLLFLLAALSAGKQAPERR